MLNGPRCMDIQLFENTQAAITQLCCAPPCAFSLFLLCRFARFFRRRRPSLISLSDDFRSPLQTLCINLDFQFSARCACVFSLLLPFLFSSPFPVGPSPLRPAQAPLLCFSQANLDCRVSGFFFVLSCAHQNTKYRSFRSFRSFNLRSRRAIY